MRSSEHDTLPLDDALEEVKKRPLWLRIPIFGAKAIFQLFLWIAIIAFFAYISYSNVLKLNELHSIEASVQSEIDLENKKTADLQKEQEYQKSDAFIEKIAREQLGLIKKDEILFIKR